MPHHPTAPEPDSSALVDDVARAGDRLREMRQALSAVTGGAVPNVVLAELAQKLAGDLAAHFDELPMRTFGGRVQRGADRLGVLLPRRRVTHSLVLARYVSATPYLTLQQSTLRQYRAAAASGEEKRYDRYYARIAVLALGDDGVLRNGIWSGFVRLLADTDVPAVPVSWDDCRVGGVPTRPLALTRWGGGSGPSHVASAGEVLAALAAIAASVADASTRDLALLKRFL